MMDGLTTLINKERVKQVYKPTSVTAYDGTSVPTEQEDQKSPKRYERKAKYQAQK